MDLDEYITGVDLFSELHYQINELELLVIKAELHGFKGFIKKYWFNKLTDNDFSKYNIETKQHQKFIDVLNQYNKLVLKFIPEYQCYIEHTLNSKGRTIENVFEAASILGGVLKHNILIDISPLYPEEFGSIPNYLFFHDYGIDESSISTLQSEKTIKFMQLIYHHKIKTISEFQDNFPEWLI